MLDCVSNQYKLEIKKNGINIDNDADHDVAIAYLAYKTLTEIQTTLAGKVPLLSNFFNTAQIKMIKSE